MNTVQRYFRVNPQDMAYVKFIVDAYEGLAVLRTVDPEEGIVEWMIPPDLMEEVEELIDSLQGEIAIVPMSPPREPRFMILPGKGKPSKRKDFIPERRDSV